MARMTKNGDARVYEFAATYADAGTKEEIMVPPAVDKVMLTLLPEGGGTSKVQTTTSPEAHVRAGTAIWVDHPDGAVGTVLQDTLDPVTAFRVVVVGGTAKIAVKAQ